MDTGVLFYADDLIGMFNEIVTIVIKYFYGVKNRDQFIGKLKGNKLFASFVFSPLSYFVMNKTIDRSFSNIYEAVHK